MGEFQGNQRADRLGHNDAEGNGYGKFEISVERKQDHENQNYGERADKEHLRFRFEELAVLAAPRHGVTLRQGHGLFHRRLSVLHSALQIAPFDAVLNADVTRVIFTVNKGCAVPLRNIGKLTERDLLSIGSAYQQVSNFMGAAAELRLHVHDQIEQLLTLNDLGDALSPDGGGNYSFYVCHVDPIPCNLVAINIDQQTSRPYRN